MKRTIGILIILLVGTMLMSSCTKNQRARSWGGTSTIDLPVNQKLVNVSWKTNDLWILVRDMKPNETPVTYQYYEKSDWGILEGTYVLKESKNESLSMNLTDPNPTYGTITITDGDVKNWVRN